MRIELQHGQVFESFGRRTNSANAHRVITTNGNREFARIEQIAHTLLYRSTPVQDKLARQLQKTWREKLGLSVTLQAEEGETFDQLLAAGEFTLALTELTALYNDASAYLDPWRSGDSRSASSTGSTDVGASPVASTVTICTPVAAATSAGTKLRPVLSL